MWDEIYSTEEYVYGKQANDFLIKNYTSIPKGQILMLAEGEGRNAVFLARQGYLVTAVDSSSAGLEKAKHLAKENSVTIEFICEDLATFDLGDKKWDGIVSISCHLPSELRQNLYKRIERALKSTGVFLFEGYRPAQLEYKTGGPPIAEMMTSKETLITELSNITFSHLKEVDREIIEGIKHHGLSAVTQAIGTPNK